jgi:hypothetical protein
MKKINITEEEVTAYGVGIIAICTMLLLGLFLSFPTQEKRNEQEYNKLLQEARYDFLMSANSNISLWNNEDKLQIERMWFDYRVQELKNRRK